MDRIGPCFVSDCQDKVIRREGIYLQFYFFTSKNFYFILKYIAKFKSIY